jgi:hypothetical protein
MICLAFLQKPNYAGQSNYTEKLVQVLTLFRPVNARLFCWKVVISKA